MNDKKFTKGPWRIYKHGGFDYGSYAYDILGVCCNVNECDINLISVAPKMYGALAMLIDNSSFNTNYPSEAEFIEKLLAEARGE